MLGGQALTGVPSEELKVLLRALHRETIDVPLTPVEVARHGLQDYSDLLLAHLRGLDRPAIRAVLVAVLAEREAGA